MGLSSLVRGAVAIADRVTSDLQVTVQHEAGSAPDGRGKVTYATPVDRLAIWEPRIRVVRRMDGAEATSIGKVTFLSSVAIGQWDRLTLPGVVQAPVLETKSVADASGAVLTEVLLGSSQSTGIN